MALVAVKIPSTYQKSLATEGALLPSIAPTIRRRRMRKPAALFQIFQPIEQCLILLRERLRAWFELLEWADSGEWRSLVPVVHRKEIASSELLADTDEALIAVVNADSKVA